MKTGTRTWSLFLLTHGYMSMNMMNECILRCNDTQSRATITAYLHFFVKRLSCLTHLSEILEAWTRLLDEEIDVIYQNYCKPLM